jgi:hypothetical protein
METLESPAVFGHTIFCDDIRHEVGGKLTFVGVYQNHLALTQFPAVLSKFGFGISFFQRPEVFEPAVKLLVFVPGDSPEVASIQVDINELSPGEVMEKASAFRETFPRADSSYIAGRANLVLEQFTINEPGAVKVRIEHRGKLVRLGAMNFFQAPK